MSSKPPPFYPLSSYYKDKYGFRVFKLGLSTGIPCPKREKGDPCAFCVPNTFTDETITDKQPSIHDQIDYLIAKLSKKVKASAYIAYFQDNTSSYGDIDYLKSLFTAAAKHPQILELSISTRPDYLYPEFLDMLKSIDKPITIEIGVQTIHDKSLLLLNRGHTHADNQSAIDLLANYPYRVGIHIILGIPNETTADINDTIHWINQNKTIADVKIHHLAAFKGSKLATMNCPLLSLDTYIPLIAHFLSHLRADITISRLFTSNLNRHQTMLNDFPGIKRQWLNKLNKYLIENNITQT